MPRKKVQKEPSASGETFAESQDEKGARLPRMSAPERGFMIDWLGLERPGEGKGMLNFRWIYGGAAKGQNMNGDAADVHASSGYTSLANYVNDKAKIKSKAGAWDATAAEKRWTTMKASYRKALNLPKPSEEGNDNLEEENEILAGNRETICGDFERLFALLGEHPATAPLHTIDSMRPSNASAGSKSLPVDEDDMEEVNDDEEEEEAHQNLLQDAESAIGSKHSRTSSNSKPTVASEAATTPHKAADKIPKEPKLSKQRIAEKKPFHLKKATSEPSHKRADIQTMFIKSQEDLAKTQQQQMRINAMLELIKAKIPQEQIPGMMTFMFGENNEYAPNRTTIYTGATDDSKMVIDHAAAAAATPTI
jgi:hypothetical protein